MKKIVFKCPYCKGEMSEFGRKGFGQWKCKNNKCKNDKLYFEEE